MLCSSAKHEWNRGQGMAERILYGREEDLSYNQTGRLSPRQAELTARPLRWAAISIGLGAVIATILGLAIPRLMQMEGPDATMVLVVVGLITLLDLGAAALVWRASQRTAQRPIEIVEGRLDQLPRGAGGALPQRMQLGGRTITVPLSSLPLRAGGRYRAYGLTVPRRGVMMTYLLSELDED
jgi:hypothetical protein